MTFSRTSSSTPATTAARSPPTCAPPATSLPIPTTSTPRDNTSSGRGAQRAPGTLVGGGTQNENEGPGRTLCTQRRGPGFAKNESLERQREAADEAPLD